MWSPTLFSLPPLSLAQFLSLCSLGFSGTLHRGAVGGWWLCGAVWGEESGEEAVEREALWRGGGGEEAERGELRRWEGVDPDCGRHDTTGQRSRNSLFALSLTIGIFEKDLTAAESLLCESRPQRKR